jgi:hypothetical protein
MLNTTTEAYVIGVAIDWMLTWAIDHFSEVFYTVLLSNCYIKFVWINTGKTISQGVH